MKDIPKIYWYYSSEDFKFYWYTGTLHNLAQFYSISKHFKSVWRENYERLCWYLYKRDRVIVFK